jgi:hypothetical protein
MAENGAGACLVSGKGEAVMMKAAMMFFDSNSK